MVEMNITDILLLRKDAVTRDDITTLTILNYKIDRNHILF